MFQLFLVMLGGAVGSGLRFAVGQVFVAPVGALPLSTLTVNVLGSGVLGAFTAFSMQKGTISNEIVLLVGVGLCGGFTTFSAFSVEVIALWDAGNPILAITYIGLSLFSCLLAVVAGAVIMRYATSLT